MPAAFDDRNWCNRDGAMVLVALIAVSLWGCTEKPDTRPLKASIPPAAMKSVQIAQLPTPRPVRQPVRLPAQKAAKKDLRPDRDLRIDPITLVGLDPSSIGRRLGPPDGTRIDAMAVEWSYAAPSCSLRIFFYPDVSTGGLKALKYNISGTRLGHSCVGFPLIARNDEPD